MKIINICMFKMTNHFVALAKNELKLTNITMNIVTMGGMWLWGLL